MENLLERLDEAFQSDDVDKKEVIKGILWDYQQSGDTDWKKYVFWNPIKYSRNLVEITPAYEIIVLCWTEDQESPIHNHSVTLQLYFLAHSYRVKIVGLLYWTAQSKRFPTWTLKWVW
eukprot:TRINITY_DN3590_c0_g2_i2.p1 TRINITY_DN3590_c0_g2~~TRINITY_DN3590_c0_g2_i2.p1  ORF type:complete len:118 (-),score=20.17 TRINITY_DN3590_c0_g2_i2:477-830(-)